MAWFLPRGCQLVLLTVVAVIIPHWQDGVRGNMAMPDVSISFLGSGTSIQVNCTALEYGSTPLNLSITFPNRTIINLGVDASYLVPVSPLENGTYSCNASGAVSSITVSSPNVTINSSRELPATVGSMVTVRCTASNTAPSHSITWSGPNGMPPSGSVNNVSDTISDLHIQVSNDAASYICHATNAVGSDSAVFTVAVVGPPTILSFSDRVLNETGSLTLPCNAVASPASNVTFQRETVNGVKTLIPTSNGRFTITPFMDGRNGSVLTVMGAVHNDSGNYTCIATNALGSVNSTVNVRVFSRPTLTLQTGNVVFNTSDSLSIKCTAIGFGEPNVSWVLSQPFNTSQTVSRSIADLEVRVVSMLKIDSLTASYNGNVSCQARNEAGLSSISTTIIVQELPSAPQSLELAPAPGVWNFAWLAAFDGNVLAPLKYFLIRRTAGQGNRSLLATNGLSLSLNVSLLQPFTDYSFTVVAENILGRGPESNSFAMRTPQARPSAPRHFNVSRISSTIVVCEWLPPSRPNGIIVSYSVEVCNNSLFCFRVNTSDNATSLMINSLQPFTNYSFAVQASTSVGAGPASESVNTQTFQAEPSPPRTVRGEAVGVDSLNVTWLPPLDTRGVLSFYSIHVRPSVIAQSYFPAGCRTNISEQASPSNQSVFVSGLCYFTNYNITVTAMSGGGLSNGSGTARTNPQGPTAPRNVRLSTTMPGAITVVWQKPQFQNGVFHDYTVVATSQGSCTPGSTGSSQGGSVTMRTTGLTVTLPSLIPFTNYTITIRSNNNNTVAGSTGGLLLGNLSSSMSLCTASQPPSFVVAPGMVDPRQTERAVRTASTLLFKLSKPSDTNGPVNFYQILALEVNNTGGSAPSLPHPDIAYRDALRSVTVYPMGASSNPVGLPWIAAEFNANDFPSDSLFSLGSAADPLVDLSARINGPLKSGTSYVITLRAFVTNPARKRRAASVLQSRTYTEFASSVFSHPMTTAVGGGSGGLGIGEIVGIVVTVTILALALAGFGLIYSYHKHVNRTQVVRGPPTEVFAMQREENSLQRQLSRKSSRGDMEWVTAGPCPADKFAEHVRRLHANDNYYFSQEYEIITNTSPQPSYEVCGAPENRCKNRYANILCYDDTRVVLSQMREDDADTTYINANYIDGYNKEKAYIATQGPVPDSIEDFWRMIWEENVHVLVMLTNLEERGRLKCHQYWPKTETEKYGVFNVHIVDTLALSDSVVRTFSLEMRGSNRSREIKHFHFSSWPDHGVPEQPTPLLNFMKRVRAAVPTNSGPLVVHCSAGVGRTGTYIAIEAQMQRLKAEKSLDIYNFLRTIRRQRNFMVQTEAQYVFVHDAILEASHTPNTEIVVTEFQRHYMEVLNNENPPNEAWNLQQEFQHLNSSCQAGLLCKAGNETINRRKNRSQDNLPIESSRVKLRVIPGHVGSDYINASHVGGYMDRKAYIVAQGPLEETLNDFWRMIWENESRNVVMLTNLEENGEEKCALYWPEEGKPTLYGDYLVSMEGETVDGDVTLRDFLVTCTKQQETVSRPIKHFHYTVWPTGGKPSSGTDVIRMLGQIQKVQQATGNKSIVVHCSSGLGRTGVFCALSICLERVKADGVLDVYQAVKAMRIQRPQLVRTVEQYQFIYEAILQYLDSFEMYSNFK